MKDFDPSKPLYVSLKEAFDELKVIRNMHSDVPRQEPTEWEVAFVVAILLPLAGYYFLSWCFVLWCSIHWLFPYGDIPTEPFTLGRIMVCMVIATVYCGARYATREHKMIGIRWKRVLGQVIAPWVSLGLLYVIYFCLWLVN